MQNHKIIPSKVILFKLFKLPKTSKIFVRPKNDIRRKSLLIMILNMKMTRLHGQISLNGHQCMLLLYFLNVLPLTRNLETIVPKKLFITYSQTLRWQFHDLFKFQGLGLVLVRAHTDFEAELLVCGYFDVLILGLFQMLCDPIAQPSSRRDRKSVVYSMVYTTIE